MAKLNILVADDEPGILNLMKDTLSRFGHNVTCAENGNEALSILNNNTMDLLFLDIRMPKGDGLSTLKEVHARWPKVPVVVITGCSQRELIDEAMDLGSFVCLIKPFSIHDVVGIVDVLYPDN